MADKEEIKIEIDLGLRNADGTSKSVKELTKYFKELKNQISDTSDGASLEALNKKLNAVEGKLGDINDAAKLVAGSGVEKLNASFGALQEGLGNADFDKVKMGFKGLGAAMDALPIFLIIEGLKMLIENFEAIYKFFQSFSDSAKEVARLEKEVARLEVSTAKQKTTLEGLVSIQEAQLELMKEQGKGSKEIAAQEEKIFQTKLDLIKVEATQIKTSAQLHLAKLQEIQDNDSLYEGMQRIEAQVQRALGNDIVADAIDKTIAQNKKERSEESQKAFEDAMNRVKQLTDEVAVLTINREKDKTAAANESTEKWKKAKDDEYAFFLDFTRRMQAYEEEQRKLKEEKRKKEAEADAKAIEDSIQAEQKAIDSKKAARERDSLDYFSKLSTDKSATFTERQTALDELKAIELKNKDLTEYQKQQIEKKYAEESKKLKLEEAATDLAIANQSVQAAQGLSDMLFAIKAANTRKGSKEEEKAARLQFKINKGLSISSTTIKGAEAVVAALTTPGPLGIAKAIAVGITTAASIAKIAATQFEGGGGGAAIDVGGGGAGGGAIAGAGSQPNFQAPTFFGLGQVSGGGSNQKQAQQVFVTEGDISKVQKRVSVIESRSRIN